MQCDRCKAMIVKGDEKEFIGQLLCEDCCMDLMSPAKACDPWAVYSAKSFLKNQKDGVQFNEAQKNILEILRKEGHTEPSKLCVRLKINANDLERELATLRHMEKMGQSEILKGHSMIN